jgi:hypothetical protein
MTVFFKPCQERVYPIFIEVFQRQLFRSYTLGCFQIFQQEGKGIAIGLDRIG